MNEKIENQLNLAMSLPEEQLLRTDDLSVGFDEVTNTWDLIVRYKSLEQTRQIPGIVVDELSNGYAILNVSERYINYLASLPEIIFIEKPKRLEFSVISAGRVSCIPQVQVSNFLPGSDTLGGLFGEGVIVGIVDSGIDYTHPAFLNQDGTTRILKLWDQVADQVYDETQINEALSSDNPYSIVDSGDPTGHGTHVAGIAAGNFAVNKNNNLGIATKSRLIVVKMATASENSFPRTTQLMKAVDFVIRQANSYGMPLSLNISFGNAYGSHDGTSLISSYLDSVIDGNLISVQIGSGNEGDSAGHAGGNITDMQARDIELQVSNFQRSLNVQLWKDFADIYEIQIIAPSGRRTAVFGESERAWSFTLDQTDLEILYGSPKPFSKFQEVYIEWIPRENFVAPGIWTIRIIPLEIVEGRYDLWLPGIMALNENTRFLEPDPFVTLTIPSDTSKAISVGAYNSSNDAIASFSGRGFLRENDQIKPDLVAPGVDITSASPGGGLEIRSGTSMATPGVTGSAALMMEWGIVRGNDPFLYGEKVKAYLIRGARKLPSVNVWPSPSAGWGALCLRESFLEQFSNKNIY